MRLGGLFSGFGGFELGLEQAGFDVRWLCEIDPYKRAVLARHWPDAHIFHDARSLGAEGIKPEPVDAICAGWPCQDVSSIGRRAGLAGERSGLWSQVRRLIRDLRPRYALLENVEGLLHRGFGDVLGDLAEIGYDAEWHCIPASHVGAPHQRDRVWIVAYPDSERRDRGRVPWRLVPARHRPAYRGVLGGGPWAAEPGVDRVAHGVPDRVDRVRGLGEALVPQIAEMLGREIMAYEALTERVG